MRRTPDKLKEKDDDSDGIDRHLWRETKSHTIAGAKPSFKVANSSGSSSSSSREAKEYIHDSISINKSRRIQWALPSFVCATLHIFLSSDEGKQARKQKVMVC